MTDNVKIGLFAVYINAIVEFDPHTFYFAPEDKIVLIFAMSNFEGIGARLLKNGCDYCE
jgi:carboxyl-terminal processing protease